MPHVEPFRGVYYSTDVAGPLDTLIAPPYDKVTAEIKRTLLARSPYNAVRLELPEHEGDPQWPQHCAETLAGWLFSGALERDEEPAYYAYEHEFEAEGRRQTRWGFLAVLRLAEAETVGVRMHEKTFDAIKAERLALLRATKANLSPVFVLYSDPQGRVRSAFEAAQGTLLCSATDDDGTVHRVRRVNDLPLLPIVQRTLKDAPMVIADGHHRFETAINYWREMRAANPTDPPGVPYHFVMVYLTPIEDAALVILPAHRAMRFPQGVSKEDLARLVRENWRVVSIPSPDQLEHALAEETASPRVGLVTSDGVALLEPLPERLDAAVEPTCSPAKRRLPVVALHALLIDPLLHGAELEHHVTFHRRASEATDLVQRGQADAAFLWRATRPAEVLAVSQAGERMPQKSTDFFPKLATGLVFNVF